MRSFADLVTIGRIVRPQGRRGEVVAAPVSDSPDRFATLSRAYVAGPDGSAREVHVTSCWPHKGRFVMKLEGVDSIGEAEAYRGLDIRIGEEELEPLPPGSYYYHQLVGLRVEDTAGRCRGVVERLLETGATPVLVVEGERGEEMIPLAEEFVHQVDLCAGRVVVTMPELVDAQD